MPECYMFLARKSEKLSQYPNFFIILPEKLTKLPNFTRFLPENARILHKNCPKIFPEFKGARDPLLPPVSYAYAQNSTRRTF